MDRAPLCVLSTTRIWRCEPVSVTLWWGVSGCRDARIVLEFAASKDM